MGITTSKSNLHADDAHVVTLPGVPDSAYASSAHGIVSAIGRTPLIPLHRIIPNAVAKVYLKCEFMNPLASVKDRIGWAMIHTAELRGELHPESHIIEPTSGNTGIALAFVAASRGYKLTLALPDSMSHERRALLRALGADFVLTPAIGGMRGAIHAAERLMEEIPHAWSPRQFENPANPKAHETTTGPEIWQATQGHVDIIVSGVGTGGTITGCTRYLRHFNPALEAVAVEPKESAVISGGRAGVHKIQGIGAGFIPANLDTSLLTSVETVASEEAFDWARRLARTEGILGGISTGANIAAAARLAMQPRNEGKVIVTFACSSGERYLSTPLYQLIGMPSPQIGIVEI